MINGKPTGQPELISIPNRVRRGYFRDNGFQLVVDLNPRLYQPNTTRDFFKLLCRLAQHQSDCVFHQLTELGDTSQVPPGPSISLAPRSSQPGDLQDALVDCYTLVVQDLHLHAMLCGDYQDRVDRISDFSNRAGDVLETLAGVGEAETMSHLVSLLVDTILKDCKTFGLCNCKAGNRFQSIPTSDVLGYEHFIPIDMSKVQRVEPDATVITQAFSWMDHTSNLEATLRHRVAAIALWRNKVLANKPVTAMPFAREAMLAHYKENPIRPHRRVGPNEPVLVELHPMYGTPSSTCKMDALRPIVMTDLLCPKKHEGTAIYVRVLTRPVVMGTGLKLLVEDTSGQCLPLMVEFPLRMPAMYYPDNLLTEIYPIGATLAIKEPYVRFGPWPGQPEICVSIPTDIQELHGDGGQDWKHASPAETASKSPLQYKDMGNKALNEAKNPHLAYLYYTRGWINPDLFAQEKLPLLMNRIQAALSAERPGAAWRDCLLLETLIKERAVSLTEAQFVKLKGRKKIAGERLRLPGFESPKDPKSSQLEDWVGGIEIRDIPGKGTGTVATRALKAGETIRLESPFLVVEMDQNIPYSFTWFPDSTPDPKTTATWLATCKLLHAMIDDPRQMNRISPLHPRANDSIVFHADVNHEAYWQFSLRASNLTEKIMKNANSSEPQTSGKFKLDFLGRDLSALSLKPDYSCMNHSCLPNTYGARTAGTAHRTIVSRDVAEGEEITTTYIPDALTYIHRKMGLQSAWGFKCSCELCTLDEADDHLMRSVLDTRWATISKNDFKAMSKHRDNLERTYTIGRVVKPELAKVLYAMTLSAGRTNQEILALGKETLLAAGYQLTTARELDTHCVAIKNIQKGILSEMEVIPLLKRISGAVTALGPRKVRPDQIRAWSEASKWLVNTFIMPPDVMASRAAKQHEVGDQEDVSDVLRVRPNETGGLTIDTSHWEKMMSDPSFNYDKWCDENIDPKMDLRKYQKEKIINGEKCMVFDVTGNPDLEEAMKVLGNMTGGKGFTFSRA